MTARQGDYWVAADARENVASICELYKRTLVKQVSSSGRRLTAQGVWAAHRRRSGVSATARRPRFNWDNLLKIVSGAGLSVLGIIVARPTALVYGCLVAFGAVVIWSQFVDAWQNGSVHYYVRQAMSLAQPEMAITVDTALNEVGLLLERYLLSAAAFLSGRGRDSAHPIDAKAVEDAWRNAGLEQDNKLWADSESAEYRSQRKLTRAVGTVALGLPLVLVVGTLVTNTAFPITLAYYYYTPLRNLSVLGLCGLGTLLIVYRGVGPEGFISSVAGYAFIGYALFPATRLAEPGTTLPAGGTLVVSHLHELCFVVALLCCAAIAWMFFRRSARTAKLGGAAHLLCALVIVMCLSASILASAFNQAYVLHLALLLEITTMVAVGISWLIKAGTDGPQTAAPQLEPSPASAPAPAG